MLAFHTIILIGMCCFLTSCGLMPQALSEAENVLDDDAIKITISREALGRQTNIRAQVDLDNNGIPQSQK